MLATAAPRLRAAAWGSLSPPAPVRAQFVSLPLSLPGRYASLRLRASAAAAAAAATPAKEGAEEMGFEEMAAGTRRRYYMLGGKGGVGKTSCAASLAVRFANNGHPTLVVSTDPAHSLSDSFAQVASPGRAPVVSDLSGGALVPVEGPEAPLFALEINPEKAREEFRAANQKNGGTGVKDFMDGMGLGVLAEQLGELKLGELLDTPPPGLDEAIAISKVMQFLEAQEYSMFSRIVFDTAPTGHTLRLLSLPDFLDASIGKILKLRSKIASATSAIKSVFGQEVQQQDAANKLEQLRERMVQVRELFRDTESTEFIIVTIPTVMAISESARLHSSLRKESVPVKRLIVNQILPPSSSDCKFCAIKRKGHLPSSFIQDQARALDMIRNDPELMGLNIIQAPLVDMEIRGVPALKFLGDIVWNMGGARYVLRLLHRESDEPVNLENSTGFPHAADP
uniref:ArsA/GET3 Anion-transporting ATPase-like domain-containing protein n=1 Tax=Oryza meridionalis TaxID=40149 RepID=A0A0E0CRF9_9ORYZ